MLTVICMAASRCLLLQCSNALLCSLQLLAQPVGLCFVLSSLLLQAFHSTYLCLQVPGLFQQFPHLQMQQQVW